MKVYIEEDELWPVYHVRREETATDFNRKFDQLVDIPDEIIAEYNATFLAFEAAWFKMRRIIGNEET